jgi:hypothetical protein
MTMMTEKHARMSFNLTDATALLARTPALLDAWLRDLPPMWQTANEGGETWSPYDVLGHLIHGEKTDWIPRARLILEHADAKPFERFDRFAQARDSDGKSLPQLLDEFTNLRTANLQVLAGLGIREVQLDRRGRHPELGGVTLRQLLATWVAHDLDHVVQVARVMASQYADEVGPWRAYLRVISGQQG